ncbi:MAG: type II secretion system F family protein [Candidatus Campbellbacteria bacterium]|nr:type II secretion system F family protein [Candidatus Campbellbacteria bacterium]
MKYKYVIERHGERIEGVENAEDKADLFDKVKQPGDTLISIEETERSGLSKFNISLDPILRKLNRVKTQEKILFAKNISAMIDSGLPISRALSVVRRQARNPKFKEVVEDLENSISKGKTFYDALQEHQGVFSDLFIAMVRAGEESGQLAQALSVVGEQMERTHTLKKKVKGAMMYPSVIIAAMIIIAILMLIYVVPSLTATFEDLDTELPASTKFIIFVSDMFKNHTLEVFLGTVALIGGFIFSLRTERGKKVFDTVTLHLPVVSGLVKESNSAATARTLSSLLSSGVEVVEALDITEEVIQNHHYRSVLAEAKKAIQKGKPLSDVFTDNEKIYPIYVGEMIAVGEETGKLSEMLSNVADFYEEDVQQKTKDLSTIVEPVLMIVVGAAVGFFALSMITPMYSIANSI